MNLNLHAHVLRTFGSNQSDHRYLVRTWKNFADRAENFTEERFNRKDKAVQFAKRFLKIKPSNAAAVINTRIDIKLRGAIVLFSIPRSS